MRIFFALLLGLLLASPTWAQYQVPAHNVPIGRGSGAQGFFAAPPGTAGQILTSNGSSSDPSFQIVGGPFADGLTATGNSQGTAFVIVAGINAFTTVPASTGAKLPVTTLAGQATVVINRGANPISVYPPTGGNIEGAGANVAVTVYPNAAATFVFRGSGLWYAK